MTARTAEELQDLLDADLAWRRTEMQALLAQVRAARGTTRAALTRAGLALLYAHWEGYAKHALSEYLRFVARRKLKMRELHPGFVAMAVDAEMRRLPDLSTTQLRNAMVRRLLEPGDDRPHIPAREVDTRSNLNSEVCRELLETLGLDAAPFETKGALIDYRLLRARNEIAHGRWSAVEADDYEELHDEVITMVVTVRNLVMRAADEGHYRRAPFVSG